MDVTPNYFPESLTKLVKQGAVLEREIEVLEHDLALINNTKNGLLHYMKLVGHAEDVHLYFLHAYHHYKIKKVVADCIKRDLDSHRMELESLKEQIKNEYTNI